MKKNVLLVAMALGFGFITSCTRDYSCNCHYDETHEDHTHEENISYLIADVSKKKAEELCEGYETTLAANPEHTHAHCDLKK